MTPISPAGIRLRVLGAMECQSKVDEHVATGLPEGQEREEPLESLRGFEEAARQRTADLRTQLARAEEFATTLRERIEPIKTGRTGEESEGGPRPELTAPAWPRHSGKAPSRVPHRCCGTIGA
ncbi:hypothetical protein ACFPZI_07325 [Streptomyces chlorus]|uniref:Uncharacterized protein n=1 Tax=Streptomyces chlorus TaxID=887452 RepID=A0ABW1DV40_9ACTN